MLIKRFNEIDFEKAKRDVILFIKDICVLDIWDKEFFVSITSELKCKEDLINQMLFVYSSIVIHTLKAQVKYELYLFLAKSFHWYFHIQVFFPSLFIKSILWFLNSKLT